MVSRLNAQTCYARVRQSLGNMEVRREPGKPCTRESRRPLELYETVERPAMRELPATPWELAVWTRAKVAQDSFADVTGLNSG